MDRLMRARRCIASAVQGGCDSAIAGQVYREGTVGPHSLRGQGARSERAGSSTAAALEARVPKNQPLRPIREVAHEAL